MNQLQIIREELDCLEAAHHVDKTVLGNFRKRLDAQRLTKDENPADHLCSFFLPVHPATQSLYLVHHRKAGSWIPPGGHIEYGESPRETVKREYAEELGFSLTREAVTLFDISITRIENHTPCKVHYDLWYTVSCRERTGYRFLKAEFHDAGWFSMKSALSQMERPDYRTIVSKLDLRV